MRRIATSTLLVLQALGAPLGAAAALAVAPAVVAGCADESQPETWVKRLNDPATRGPAVKRLIQFFEDAMTRANKDRSDAKVKELLDKIAAPMAETYVKQTLDSRTRVELIKFLSDTHDPRTKPALIKALAGFADGQGPSEDDVRWASPAVGVLKCEECAEAMGKAFVKVKAGTEAGSRAYKNLHDAMLELKSPSWKALLVERLGKPVERPADKKDPDKIEPYQNEQFWQVTSAELLGELRDPGAVKALFKVALTPSKSDFHATCHAAIIKIGAPAVPQLVEALLGKDADIVEYAKSQSGGSVEEAKGYVRVAAIALAALGRGDAAGPMVEAMNATDSDVSRALVGRELTKLPSTPDAIKAWQAAFEKVGPSVLIPPGNNAKREMMEAASRFYDPQLVPWIVKQIKDAKGGEGEKDAVQVAGLITAIKLMKKDQMGDVKALVDKVGTKIEKDAFKLASDVLGACGEDVGCYLAKIEETEAQAQPTQMIGIKATYMLGVLGNEATAMEVVKRLPKVRNIAIRFASVAAVDHLLPKGSAAVADALEKRIVEDKAKGDRDVLGANEAIKPMLHRLRARQ